MKLTSHTVKCEKKHTVLDMYFLRLLLCTRDISILHSFENVTKCSDTIHLPRKPGKLRVLKVGIKLF